MTKLTLRIEQDDTAESPRTAYDELGIMYCFHERHNLGDENVENTFKNPAELHAARKRHKWIALPLFLFDHSGLTMSTTPFSCPWDSGQVGYICVPRETVRKEWNVKRISPKLKAQVEKTLRGEVATYDLWLQGDVWGYVIEDENGNHVDSCWGFYGREYCEQEAEEMFESFKEAYRPDYEI